MNERSVSTNLRELQLSELEILKELDRICKKLDLRYMIFSGTLLGAVRHRGFIPWDDDVDVIMFRADYDRLKNEAPKELQECYFLQTIESDSGYPNIHTKLRNSGTTFVEECVANREMNHGIYIDIFPMDGVPDNLLLRSIGWIAISTIGRIAWMKSVPNNENSFKIKIINKFIGVIPLSGKTMSRMYSRLCSLVDINKTKHVAFSTWPKDSLKHIVYDKESFVETVMLEFEGMLLPAPIKYDTILTHLYHDYMKLPPEGKRSGHTTVNISTINPYTKLLGVPKKEK